MAERDCRVSKRRRSINNRELLLAVGNGDVRQADVLINENRADVNFTDAEGNTALHWAAEKGKMNMIELLLKQEKLQTVVENKENKTALDVAWRSKQIDTCRRLGERLEDEAQQTIRDFYENMQPRTITKPSSFRDATWSGKYDIPFSRNDVQNILTFMCEPLPTERPEEFHFIVKLHLDSASITLLHSNEGKTYFFYTEEVTETTWKASFEIVEKSSQSNRAVDIVLLKACKVFKWLSELYRNRDKKNKKQKAKQDERNTSQDGKELDKFFKYKENEGNKRGQIDYKKEIEKILAQQEDHLQDPKKYRQLFAAMLDEMERTKAKVKKCTEFLKKILEEDAQFSYKTAVTLVLCFETFAAQDSFSEVQLEEQESTTLKNMKKLYCARHFPDHLQPEIKSFLVLFQMWRENLVKNDGSHIITKDAFENAFKVNNTEIKKVLEDFHEFSLIVSENIAQEKGIDEKRKDIHLKDFAFLLNSSFTSFKQKIANSGQMQTLNPAIDGAVDAPEEGQSFFKRFSTNCKMLEGVPLVIYELLFDLLVNLCPQMQVTSPGLKSEKVNKLRNVVIHDFQTKTIAHIKEELPSVVLHLYRRQLAEKINEVLIQFRDEEECTELEKEFNISLALVDKNFVSFMYLQERVDRLENGITEERVTELTKTYMKYLAPLLDRPISNDDDDDITSASAPQELSGQQMRQLCEQFITLEQLNKCNHITELIRQEGALQRDLQKQLKLDDGEARNTIKKIKMSFNSTSNEAFESDILHIVNSLLSLVIGGEGKKSLLSCDDFLFFIKNSKTDASRFTFENHQAGLSHCVLTREEKEKVENVLQYLPSNTQEREIENGHETVVVNVCSVVSHLLSLFVEEYEARQIQIDSMASAFRDKIFLEYLVRLQVQRVPNEKTFELQDIFRTYKIIRDVQKINYTAPYLARLLGRTANMRVFDYATMKLIINSLVAGGDAFSLECILSVQSDKIITAVTEVILDDNFPKERLNILLKALCDSKRIKIFVESMHSNLKSIKRTEMFTERMRQILKVANDIALNFIYEKKLPWATDLIYSTELLESSLLEKNLYTKDTNITSERNLHKAKLLNEHGRDLYTLIAQSKEEEEIKKKKNKCREYYEGALKALESVQNDENPAIQMLAMSRKSYTYFLLGRLNFHPENASKALHLAEELWKEMCKYICGGDEPLHVDSFAQLYNRAKESTRYQNLLTLGPEYSQYLHILKLKTGVLFYTFHVNKVKNNWLGLTSLLEKWVVFDTWCQKEMPKLKLKLKRGEILHKRQSIHSLLSKRLKENESRMYHRIKQLEILLIWYKILASQGIYTNEVKSLVRAMEKVLESHQCQEIKLASPRRPADSASSQNWRSRD